MTTEYWADDYWHCTRMTPLKPISLDPQHRWWFVERNMKDSFARAMAQMDWAIWDYELALEKTIAG